VVGVATLGGHIFNAPGAFISGILTATSFSVGTNQVVSSARQLQNIATLDATTKTTIETAISGAPNDFDDLNVVGLATVNRLFVSGDTRGLNILGVTTGLSAPGISTLGIVTGATSLQATDVYTNFLHGNGANITGISTLNITDYGVGLGGGGSAGITVQDEGSALSTLATTLNFVGSGVVASGSGATKTITVNTGSGDTTNIRTNTLVVGEYSSGVSTFVGNVDVNANIDVSGSSTLHNGLVVNGGIVDINHQIVGLQTNNVIPFYYDNIADFPSASTYHGAVAHAHNTGLLYFAHAGWKEIVSKDANGVVGKIIVGTAVTIDQNNIDAGSFVGIITAKEFHGDGSNLTGITGITTTDIRTNTLVVGEYSSGVSTFSSRVQVGTGITLDQGNINLGEVTGIVTASSFVGGGDGKFVTAEWTVGANGSSHYTLTGPGGLSNADDPTIYLARGQTYQFVNNSGGSHPFEIRQSAGGSAYNTGVTNNGASAGIIKFEVPFAAPNTLVYQCQNHSSMVGNIVIYPSI